MPTIALAAASAAALAIIVTQAVICVLLLKCVRSFGAFTSALIHTHDENMLVHAHNIELAGEIGRATRKMQRITEVLSDRSFGIPSAPIEEKSA